MLLSLFYNFFFFFVSNLILVLALFVIYVKNSVHSVLFLILVFLNSMFLLILLKIEFLAFLLILIYVGAIAVLFLFVVMMLDINVKNLSKHEYKGYIPICFIIFITFFYQINFVLNEIYPYSNVFMHNLFSKKIIIGNWIMYLDNISNIQTIGQILYTYCFIFFLLAGIILLISVLGVVLLTLKQKNTKQQQIFQQFSRNYINATFLIKKKK